MKPLRPLLVLGTRPEAIKMAPVVLACQAHPRIEPLVCFTGQHDEMLRQVTDYFGIQPDLDLALMRPGQSLGQLTARCVAALDEVLEQHRPDFVVAQGDTTSVLAAGIASFYRRTPLLHVEAGLRTGDMQSPFPEEFNRRVVGLVATHHAAPTERAAQALLREGATPKTVRVVGNTVIDALQWTLGREIDNSRAWESRYDFIAGRTVILVTAHRRENHGAGLAGVFQALAQLARERPEVAILFPVHPNPNVRSAVEAYLPGTENVHLLDPLAYPEFVWLMHRAKVLVSDSGGVQEEAPTLRRPVVALRESTERMEAVECGAVELVGCARERVFAALTRLLDDPVWYAQRQGTGNPFGDGQAAQRIVEWMLEGAGAP